MEAALPEYPMLDFDVYDDFTRIYDEAAAGKSAAVSSSAAAGSAGSLSVLPDGAAAGASGSPTLAMWAPGSGAAGASAAYWSDPSSSGPPPATRARSSRLAHLAFHLSGVVWPPQLIDLLARMIDIDPAARITAAAALRHPFFEVDTTAVDDALWPRRSR